jgi:thymidylate synthase
MNNLDKQYQALLQDILDNGVTKMDRTGTGTLSLFGRQIRHKMSNGFPLLTTKKLHWKSIVGELLWFLKGSTDIRHLWKDNISIWDGDWFKKYKNSCSSPYTLEEIKQKVKTGGHSFHDSMFNLGPIYGAGWRSTQHNGKIIDQIAILINELKTNPDDRGIIVSAWNVGELDNMVLRPCHYSFQFFTKELRPIERAKLASENIDDFNKLIINNDEEIDKICNIRKIPTRSISLMYNARSQDVPLGTPFNIASYGLLLEIIAKAVNMVPDELIANMGDCHIYLNQIEPIKEQLNREPFPLPTLNINTEFWKTESGECGVGPLATNLYDLEISDFTIENYQSHPSIKIPLSN